MTRRRRGSGRGAGRGRGAKSNAPKRTKRGQDTSDSDDDDEQTPESDSSSASTPTPPPTTSESKPNPKEVKKRKKATAAPQVFTSLRGRRYLQNEDEEDEEDGNVDYLFEKDEEDEEGGSQRENARKDQEDDATREERKKKALAMSKDNRALLSCVTCRICKGYLIDAVTITECLHSFCKSCLLEHFEDVDYNCPRCGNLIHQSHPMNYVMFDRTLQELVYKIVPGLQKKEEERRSKHQRVRGHRVKERTEPEDGPKRVPQDELYRRCQNRCYVGGLTSSHHRNEKQVSVEIANDTDYLPTPTRRFIRTGEMCTVTVLKKYLSYSLYGTTDRYNDFDLFHNGALMGRDFSIKFMVISRCQKERHEPGFMLKLQYRSRVV